MSATSKVETAFAAWCKLNETERSEFDARCWGVREYLKVQTQQNAGTKAATTRRANKQKPQKPQPLAAIGEPA